MATSPPSSPSPGSIQRPMSAIARPSGRSSSRLSMGHSVSGKTGAGASGSRASDEDSRTAVRVAVRVRPPLKATDPGFELIPQRFQRSMVQTTSNTSLAIDSPQGRKLFVFDRVFSPDITQEGIWDYLSESINSFVQGYNVSVLAYGQSGAGKSYTMGTSGPSEQYDTEMMGVIPRAAAALFEKLDASKPASGIGSPNGKANRSSMSHLRGPRSYGQHSLLGDRNWSLKATYVEIYNEQLRDLLVPENMVTVDRVNVAIREDVKGNIILTGLHQVDIESVEDLMNALNFGSSIRQTDATAINAKSSRSHAVFSLNLVQRKSKLQAPQGSENKRFSMPVEALTGQDVFVTTDSKLHFVDLAGSERLKNTGAQGERAKEGISINAGLASLGKVISQLSSRQAGSHVSYRDSKLTRLLQDSLGGNAYTYMIACVTPAEFHLSETLNTVQYAQRARAIQSKPRIQQIEEGDKQAIVDRLKAEVAFLREQIRSNSQREAASPRRATAASERNDREKEREAEMQNQLLDAQENYNALSQRHARLISEMARARDHEPEEMMHGDSADERLHRSNNFQQMVDKVVLEYETTIQSLEQSLSSTRGTLSNTEATLLEKETKLAYIETLNTQLHSRVQKLMDRENSTENYLNDLETKLDGHTNGDEKNTAIIMELRKEIARIRDSESSAEDYISTLEERLAEADQDTELMQREIDRLEQVVERQRSLGKLDSLLYELDHVQDAKQPDPETAERATSSHGRRRSGVADHSRNLSHVSRQSQLDEAIPEGDEEQEVVDPKISTVKEEEGETDAELAPQTNGDHPLQSPAQSKFVADKLENVTQELLDLRVEHETTVTDFDGLQTRYEEAIRTIAELRDAVDEARHPIRSARTSSISAGSASETRPDSFLSESRSSDPKDGPLSSPSRSLSSELSSAMESPATAATSDANVIADAASEDDTATAKPDTSTDDLVQTHNLQMAAELEHLQTLASEKAEAERELAERYAQLESQHAEALDMVEELRTEVTKARNVEATSPRTSTPVIRRKSSQNLLGTDRAQRSFVSLRNIATDNLYDRPDAMQSFELNITAAMHELQSRSDRIVELEADVTSAKKEMETKMTIITGLTRERSSLTASPRDMSMVATLRGQLEETEAQLASMRSAHEGREGELTRELAALKASLAQSPVGGSAHAEHRNGVSDGEAKVAEMQTELATWESKHKETLDALENTEANMRTTVQQLEAEIEAANAKLASAEAQTSDAAREHTESSTAEEKQLVQLLRGEMDEYKAIINSNSTKIADLEREHAQAKSELEETARSYEAATSEAGRHRELVTRLEEQIAAHQQATKAHHEGLELLKKTHTEELAGLQDSERRGYQEQVEVLLTEHADAVQKLEMEVTDARDDLLKVATQVAYALGLDVSIEKLTERIDDLIADASGVAESQARVTELEKHVHEMSGINDAIMKDLESTRSVLGELLAGRKDAPSSVVEQVAAVKARMAELANKSDKNSRLVEELEEQLQNNFDEAQQTNNRLSTLQTERNAQLEEALNARSRMQSELDTIRDEYSSLQSRFDDVVSGEGRRASTNSVVRKSASHTSLPSPPPAIPLPPLPGTASPTPGTVPSSPTTMRPASKDNFNISQITEDQEARIRTIEKHLYAERQLTQTLEEALTDLEKQSNKIKADCDAWKRRASDLEGEVKTLRERPAAAEANAQQQQQDNRWSLQAVEEERKKRQAAEAARRQLEERMNVMNKSGAKKKKGSLNCF